MFAYILIFKFNFVLFILYNKVHMFVRIKHLKPNNNLYNLNIFYFILMGVTVVGNFKFIN